MTFDECYKKHFPNVFSMFYESIDFEELSLTLLKSYKGEYELSFPFKIALVLHAQLGNISGWNTFRLLDSFSDNKEFVTDVLYELVPNNMYDKYTECSQKIIEILDTNQRSKIYTSDYDLMKHQNINGLQEEDEDFGRFFDGMDREELDGWNDWFEYVDNH